MTTQIYKKGFWVLLILGLTGMVRAQSLDWMGQTALAPTAAQGAVEWNNQFTFYGDNNEFFEPFRVRETLLGQQFKSFLDISVKQNVDLWAGVFADRQSAQAVTTNVQPVFSFVYHEGGTQFVFGTATGFDRREPRNF